MNDLTDTLQWCADEQDGEGSNCDPFRLANLRPENPDLTQNASDYISQDKECQANDVDSIKNSMGPSTE